MSSIDEKKGPAMASTRASISAGYTGDVEDPTGIYADSASDHFEVFKKTHADGSAAVDFRTVGWVRACMIFLKIIFATGVLSIPSAMYELGAVGGALSVVGWGALNTYLAVVQGDFRNNHAGVHTIVDMAEIVGGAWLKELTGALYLIAYAICGGSGIIGVSVGLNALSHHAACTVWWSLLATVVIAAFASVRKFHEIGALTWVGFFSIFVAVFIVVVGVTTTSRPAAAPQTGDFDLGYRVVAYPSFIAGMSASATIFVSSAGTSAMIPVIAEMRNPRDYRKALFVCMGFVNAAYLAFSLVVYKWCGKWVASPSLGSAGQTLKMVAYGIGLAGLVISACLYIHVAAKYVFVRLLRGTRHLQSGTWTHWAVWLGLTAGFSALSFLLASAIPIFNYLLALVGSLCFAPLAIMLPAYFWIYDHGAARTGSLGQQAFYWFHWVVFALGAFFLVGGTYGTCQLIRDAYATGLIGKAFDCADNSNSS
jgi:hypothetical protein